MAAYVIVSVRAVRDAEKLQRYREEFDRLIEEGGGRRLVSTDRVHAVEGDWTPARLAVYEFPSLEAVRAGYASPAYQPLMALRQEAVDADIVVVEGL